MTHVYAGLGSNVDKDTELDLATGEVAVEIQFQGDGKIEIVGGIG